MNFNTITTSSLWANTTNEDYDYLDTSANSTASVASVGWTVSTIGVSNTTRSRRRFFSTDLSTLVNLILSFYRAYGLPVVILVGVFGNCFVLYVFARHTVGVSRSTRVYYVLLALVDCSSLLTYNLAQFLSLGLNTISARTFNIKIETYSNIVCGLDRYMFYLSETLSNYFYMV